MEPRINQPIICTEGPRFSPGLYVMKKAVFLFSGFLAACTTTPTSPTSWSTDRLREQLLMSNVNSALFGSSGRLTRWRVPIPVNTNGIARAETALAHFEQWTSGTVRFTRVGQAPANGLTFVEGGAGGPESTESCGSLGDVQSVARNPRLAFQWDSSRAITGAYTIHLGAERCDDAFAGPYPSSVAEHQLAHALGVIDHFDGFQHRGGLDDPRLLGVVYNLYANPVGASANELTIWGIR
jgi:hypothetical protein